MDGSHTAWELPVSPTFLPMVRSGPEPMCEPSVRFGRLPWASIFGKRPPAWRFTSSPRLRDHFSTSDSPSGTPRAAAPGRLGSVVARPHNARHGRASAQACDCGFDVFSGSRIVGRILLSDASPASQWVWTVSYGYHKGRTRTNGYAESREAASRHSRRVGTESEATRHKRTPSVEASGVVRASSSLLARAVPRLFSRPRTFRPTFLLSSSRAAW